MTALIYLALALSPDTGDLVARLGDRSFSVREKAMRALTVRMSYALAVRLEFTRGSTPEASRRLANLVGDYWSAAYAVSPVPYLDSLNPRGCCGVAEWPWLERYVNRCTDVPGARGWAWPEYRAATALLLSDLRRWRVPPAFVRPVLVGMTKHSAEYDRQRGYKPTPGP